MIKLTQRNVIIILCILVFIYIMYRRFFKFKFPVEGYSLKNISQDYGGDHNGIDIAAAAGTPILAAMDGKVESVYYDNLGGNQIILNHFANKKTGYAHLTDTFVKVGDKVTRGQKIGTVGWTGYVIPASPAGAHLHFVVTKDGANVDPKKWL